MSNIHLIATDKPSRLFKDDFGRLIYSINIDQEQNHFEPQHIYITSDEEIIEGDWCYQVELNDGKVDKCYDVTLYHTWTNNGVDKTRKFKKIILTTDTDLIKDGVQAIDDEFLEWFVKNPSCEEVEIGEGVRYEDEWIDNEDGGEIFQHQYCCYKIIIPKEPKLINNCPKCGLDLIIREHYTPICTDIDCRGIILSNETLREWASKKESKQETVFENAKLILRKHILKNKEQIIKDLSEMREQSNEQETLEEAAEKYAKQFDYAEDSSPPIDFVEGAKWQQERMYSEEDMIEFGFSTYCYISELMGVPFNLMSENRLNAEEWFEQFKKS